MRQKTGGGRKGTGGGPILLTPGASSRTGSSAATQETSTGDAYYNNPNVSRKQLLIFPRFIAK